MVCWSEIAMLKEYLFLALALSAMAVLAALTLHEKCCTTGKPKDLESNQEEGNLPDGQPLIRSRRQGEIESEVKEKRLEKGLEDERQLEEEQAVKQKRNDVEDLLPSVTMRSTMSGLCSCLASLWICVFLPCVSVFCCCCSDFWEFFLEKFEPF